MYSDAGEKSIFTLPENEHPLYGMSSSQGAIAVTGEPQENALGRMFLQLRVKTVVKVV